MSLESSRKSNNPSLSLGQWIDRNVRLPEDPFNAVLWPRDYEFANSIANETDVSFVTAIDNTATSEYFSRLSNVMQKELFSYKLAENTP